MKATIYDVAKMAGVSIATVSKVINNTGRISEKTRKKVLKVIEQLNYQPNVMATALTGKYTHTIGLVIPDLANPFFAELARSIEDRGHELGYSLVICSTDYLPEKEAKYLELLRRKSVDGIILASGFEKMKLVEQLIEERFPVSIVARDFPSFAVNAVSIDDFLGGYEATSYLVKLGHTNIGIIARDVWSNRERMRGYLKVLEEHQLQPHPSFQFVQESNVEWGRRVANLLLDSPQPPSAIFACNDLLAAGAIQAAKEHGLTVPGDLSVIGFDNTILATITDPPLTTVSQPIQSMGREVIDLMVSEIKNEKGHKSRIVLLPELVVRDSTAPLKPKK
ncbi:LacI family transcriptional regulator [Brevibacillus humidisoli]|uniref:LacI family DNA-binding transcriptional regulator n=1 Tax=Brevibacillus humidisoli TaxID=2895522 RepID=UPI001E5BFBC0|nr:LacI family DNA-binding transcriptional regulator [Brevibacillus humidisoli]UFJ39918.1 LacI family transcriptional regulator [Brevibacillus humidisoli]